MDYTQELNDILDTIQDIRGDTNQLKTDITALNGMVGDTNTLMVDGVNREQTIYEGIILLTIVMTMYLIYSFITRCFR